MSIRSLAAGGDGVARLPDGLALFVPLSAPGDRVRVRIVERRRRFARGEISEVLEEGPKRCAPRCAVFGRCGGCSWQHLEYSAQVGAKQEILREALVRIGGWKLPDELAFVPSPDSYGYRIRARLLAGRAGIGYRERASHTLCAVNGCPILAPALDAEVARLGADENLVADASSEHEWELVAGQEGRVRSRPLELLDSPHASDPPGGIVLTADGDSLQVSFGTFVQANGSLHSALRAAVLGLAGRGRRALELHAGAGFFTLALARRFSEFEAVEASPGAVGDLRTNLRAAGLDHVRVIEGDVEQVLELGVSPAPELIFLDPPRAGLSPGSLESLADLSAPRIVYLSCDPATLARDTARLGERGYCLASVQGFDLFPQTSHVEALALLVKSGSDDLRDSALLGDQG